MQSVNELFTKVLEMTTDELYCLLPCQVVGVSGNYVDVKVFINDDEPDMVLYHVPIQRPETQRAYIYLGIKSGDRGTLKFFDRSVEGYLQSDFDYNSDDRQHDISDRAFELGFLPDAEAFVYPTDKEIEIGLKNVKFKLSVDDDGNIDFLTEGDITLNVKGAVTATIEGDVESTIKGDMTSTIEGDMKSLIKGNQTSTVNGIANITAPTINSTGALTHNGTLTVNGVTTTTQSLSSPQLISGNGATGTYSSVIVENGIVIRGS